MSSDSGFGGNDAPRSEGEALEQIYRAIAELQVGLNRIAKNQDSFKTEIRAVAPRVDALGSRIEALSADVRQMGERLHASNNLVVRALDEASRVHEEYRTLDRAIDAFESQLKLKTRALEQSQSTLEKMVDVLETRVGRLRDSMIPGVLEEVTDQEGKRNG
jgi:chromosome segregation ATPase